MNIHASELRGLCEKSEEEVKEQEEEGEKMAESVFYCFN
jgi:hypothetical protein